MQKYYSRASLEYMLVTNVRERGGRERERERMNEREKWLGTDAKD